MFIWNIDECMIPILNLTYYLVQYHCKPYILILGHDLQIWRFLHGIYGSYLAADLAVPFPSLPFDAPSEPSDNRTDHQDWLTLDWRVNTRSRALMTCDCTGPETYPQLLNAAGHRFQLQWVVSTGPGCGRQQQRRNLRWEQHQQKKKKRKKKKKKKCPRNRIMIPHTFSKPWNRTRRTRSQHPEDLQTGSRTWSPRAEKDIDKV